MRADVTKGSEGARDIRVLIADDEALIRAGFTVLVDSAPGLRVVGEASDGVQAVRQTRALKPGVVLMDIRMPVMDGLEATKVIVDGGQEPAPRAAARPGQGALARLTDRERDV
jgi:DNA-binding NarL/FixJ family response regulator